MKLVISSNFIKQPRAATIVSKYDGLLFFMNRDQFKMLVICSSFNRRRNYENFLLSMPLLTFSLNKYEICQVADSLVTYDYSAGECIFKQNDEPDGMYFIQQGGVKVLHTEADEKDSRCVLIRELKEGEFFGELALVNKGRRSASVYALSESPCKLAFLKIEAFERLIGPCREFIKYRIISYNNVT